MKVILISLCLVVSTVGIAQGAKERAKLLASDKIGAFSASDDAVVSVVNDGSTRIVREYSSGNQSLNIKISVAQDSEAFEKVSSEIDELIGMFKELADAGKMEISMVEKEKVSGILTFRGTGGSAILLGYNRFVIELNMIGAADMNDFKSVFDTLNLSVLKKQKKE